MKLGLRGSKQDPYIWCHKINKQAVLKEDGGPIVAQRKRKKEKERGGGGRERGGEEEEDEIGDERGEEEGEGEGEEGEEEREERGTVKRTKRIDWLLVLWWDCEGRKGFWGGFQMVGGRGWPSPPLNTYQTLNHLK